MIVKVKDCELHLNSVDVAASKKLVSNFLDSVKKEAGESLNPTFYFTLLIVMHMLSQDLLNEMDSDTLKIVYDRLGKK